MYKGRKKGSGETMIRLGVFYQASVFFASVPRHLKMKRIHLAFRMNGFNKGSELEKGGGWESESE